MTHLSVHNPLDIRTFFFDVLNIYRVIYTLHMTFLLCVPTLIIAGQLVNKNITIVRPKDILSLLANTNPRSTVLYAALSVTSTVHLH